MKIIIVTGSNGLIGSESVKFFSKKFDLVVGIDNDYRKKFFGNNASTNWLKKYLLSNIPNYIHYNIDICDNTSLNKIFSKYNNDIKLIIHSAAQPSHDWAATNPHLDFDVNARGTLNLLKQQDYIRINLLLFLPLQIKYMEIHQINLNIKKQRLVLKF